jgi:hypothetical protein
MQKFLKILLITGVAIFATASYAGLAEDVKKAYSQGNEVRPIIDDYISSSGFTLEEFISELAGMPVNAPAAVVYLVEHDEKYARPLVVALLDDNVDTLVVSVVLAAKGKSPSMCPMVKAMAQENKGTAAEAIVAVSTEVPSRANRAVKCARSEGLDIDIGLGGGEAPELELQLGGGGGGPDTPEPPEPPVSPN